MELNKIAISDNEWNLEKYISYFFIYSFIGWLFEELLFLILYNDLVFRGFLYLPILPIYGFGVVFISIIFSDAKYDAFSIFVISFLFCSLFEYFTAYILEEFLNIKLWNYNELKYNLNGRVSFVSSIFFALCLVIIVKKINPFLEKRIKKYRNNLGLEILLSIMIIVFLFDFCLSLIKYLNIL